MREPPGTFKRDSWGLPPQLSPAQPSPALPSPPLADAKHKHLLASSGEGKGKRQEPQDYGKILSGRWLTNAGGMAGRGASVEGMGCATAGPAFFGLCRTQETTSGAVPAQQYAECSEEHTVKASHPLHIHFPTHEPAPCCDSHQLPGQCGKQDPRVRALHRLRPRRSS